MLKNLITGVKENRIKNFYNVQGSNFEGFKPEFKKLEITSFKEKFQNVSSVGESKTLSKPLLDLLELCVGHQIYDIQRNSLEKFFKISFKTGNYISQATGDLVELDLEVLEDIFRGNAGNPSKAVIDESSREVTEDNVTDTVTKVLDSKKFMLFSISVVVMGISLGLVVKSSSVKLLEEVKK